MFIKRKVRIKLAELLQQRWFNRPQILASFREYCKTSCTMPKRVTDFADWPYQLRWFSQMNLRSKICITRCLFITTNDQLLDHLWKRTEITTSSVNPCQAITLRKCTCTWYMISCDFISLPPTTIFLFLSVPYIFLQYALILLPVSYELTVKSCIMMVSRDNLWNDWWLFEHV